MGCKFKEIWWIGIEYEKFGYCKDMLKLLFYDGDCLILVIFEGLWDCYGWVLVMEVDKFIGFEKEGVNVSLESGGVLELFGVFLENIY